MGSIDGYKYPDRSPQEIVEVADVVVNQHGGKAGSKEKFAQDLGHSSAKSGTFMQKMADARKFGILQKRGIEATELAYTIANPENEEVENEAMLKMFRNVPLLRDIYDHVDGGEISESFWRILMKITDSNPKDAKESADDIKNLYQEMLQYAHADTLETSDNTENLEQEEDDSEIITETISATEDPVSESGIYLKVAGNTLNLEEVSVMNLQLAQTMLSHMEQKLKQANSQVMMEDNKEEETDNQDNPGLDTFMT